jgi:hypothetical protein
MRILAEETMAEEGKYKLDWMDWITICITLIVLGMVLGYRWRMHHEAKALRNAPVQQTFTAADLALEISKGKEFFIYADNDTMLHYIAGRF